MDISFNIQVMVMNFFYSGQNIHREGSMSQIFDIGLSFDFIQKKRVTFDHFLKHNFLDIIKEKLRPKSKI